MSKNNKILCPFHGHLLHEPQTPQCTISKGFVVCLFAPLSNFATYCLPFVHASQNNIEVGQEILPRFMSFNMLWSARMLFTFKWPSRRCQSSTGPLPHLNAWNWPHPLRIPLWKPFGSNTIEIVKLVCEVKKIENFGYYSIGITYYDDKLSRNLNHSLDAWSRNQTTYEQKEHELRLMFIWWDIECLQKIGIVSGKKDDLHKLA